MAAKALAMEQLKQILRLRRDGFSIKAIVRHTGISRPTVKKYLSKIKGSGVDSDEAACFNNAELSALMAKDSTAAKSMRYLHLAEHFGYAEKEISKTGVTRQLLWSEYKTLHDDGYNYSQYCYHFKEYLRHKEVVMHLEHKAAETVMIDFAGKKLSYVDPDSAEVIECHVFVAVLPHSGLIFCKAVHSQNTYDFMDCLNSMLKFYGGTTQTILCDNLKTAVTRPSRYEPVFTDMCCQLSEHYDTSFSATRPYKPRDKAMVERSVNIIYTHVYAPLRHQVFGSLAELNGAMQLQLEKLNHKTYKNSAYSRTALFEQQEKHLLKSLPCAPFILKKSVEATVQRNYHVQLSEDHRYYSVPYQYAGKKVRVLYDNKTVEIYYEHSRIAVHTRSSMTRAYYTIAEHMPSHHRYAMDIKGWTQADLLAKAAQIGTHTHKVVEHILSSSIYPEQNYKSCHGLLMLQKGFGTQRLEAACVRALHGTRINYTMIKNILQAGLDKQPPVIQQQIQLPGHENIRGADHYH
jgi:transposase